MSIGIVVCGNQSNVIEITKRLNSDCTIICFTDVASIRKSYVQFDGHPYGNIDKYAFDYLIVSYSEDKLIEEAIKEFRAYRDKTIIYSWFKNSTIIDPINKYMSSSYEYQRIILGMSHSQNGILTQYLSIPTYKFSLPSMDLFCHYKIVDKIAEDSNIKEVILELPYYIFNYDLSKSKRSAKSRLFYFEKLGGYHNYGATDDNEKNVISQFQHYLKIFNNDNMLTTINNFEIDINTKESVKSRCFKIIKQIMVIKENTSVWTKYRDETINENEHIFNELIDLIKRKFPAATIRIVICPFNPLFRLKNRKAITQTKKIFYKILSNTSIDIIDNFTKYINPFDFLDHCHLTVGTAIEYTKFLDEYLSRRN